MFLFIHAELEHFISSEQSSKSLLLLEILKVRIYTLVRVSLQMFSPFLLSITLCLSSTNYKLVTFFKKEVSCHLLIFHQHSMKSASASQGGHLHSKMDMMLVQEKSKKGCFNSTVDVHEYIEKGVKNSKIWKTGYVFQHLKL